MQHLETYDNLNIIIRYSFFESNPNHLWLGLFDRASAEFHSCKAIYSKEKKKVKAIYTL